MRTPPKTKSEFDAWFRNDRACRDFLFQLRWPNGFVCPRCQSERYWRTGREAIVCRACGKQTSVTAGTIFQDSQQPLRLWFRAIWYVVVSAHGDSASVLQRRLELGSYRTAWSLLHKLRRVMLRAESARLSGAVEAGVFSLGPKSPTRSQTKNRRHILMAVAAEIHGERIGRIHLRRIDTESLEGLAAFVREVVEPGSRVGMFNGQSTDEAPKCVQRVVHSLGTRLRDKQGCAISRDHLDYYLAEFTFRFNHRDTASRWSVIRHLIQHAVCSDPVPYKSLIRPGCRANSGKKSRPDKPPRRR